MNKFDNLYTAKEASLIYGFHQSYLRKKIDLGYLIEGRDVKKFGNTWVITEEALVSSFGKFPDSALDINLGKELK